MPIAITCARLVRRAREQLAHQRAHARQHDAGADAHVDRLAVAREHLQVGREHGHLDARRAEVGAQQHAERAMQLQRLGAPAAGRCARADLVEPALLDQPGDDRVGARLREVEVRGQPLPRRAMRPEHGFEHARLRRRQVGPNDSSLRRLLVFSHRALRPGGRMVGVRLSPRNNEL
jgi:hypothetical protein